MCRFVCTICSPAVHWWNQFQLWISQIIPSSGIFGFESVATVIIITTCECNSQCEQVVRTSRPTANKQTNKSTTRSVSRFLTPINDIRSNLEVIWDLRLALILFWIDVLRLMTAIEDVLFLLWRFWSGLAITIEKKQKFNQTNLHWLDGLQTDWNTTQCY